MNVRSRIEWASMWGVLADHFGTVGCISGSPSVAMYTVDCLRQLALKFLDKVCFGVSTTVNLHAYNNITAHRVYSVKVMKLGDRT